MVPEHGVRRHLLLVGSVVGMLCGLLLSTGCEKKTAEEKPATEKQATEKPTTRVTFQELFDLNGTTVTPKKVMRIGSITMTPEVPFDSQIMRIDDAPFSQFIGHDAEIRKVGDLYEVKFY